MEPAWSALGQASGVAAALAIDLDVPLKDVPVSKIQDELVKQKCHLCFYADLFEIRHANKRPCLLFGHAQSGHEEGGQDGDDRDHHQKFN